MLRELVTSRRELVTSRCEAIGTAISWTDSWTNAPHTQLRADARRSSAISPGGDLLGRYRARLAPPTLVAKARVTWIGHTVVSVRSAPSHSWLECVRVRVEETTSSREGRVRVGKGALLRGDEVTRGRDRQLRWRVRGSSGETDGSMSPPKGAPDGRESSKREI